MKRLIGLLLIAVLCFCAAIPAVQTDAASTVTITYNGTKKTYKNTKSYVYVNNTKRQLKKQPVFKKNGCYMGPVNKIFKNSSLKVTTKSTSTQLTLQYGSNTVVLKNGSKKVTVNGKTDPNPLGAKAIRATFSNGKTRWVVPLKSVCSRLGITYSLSNGVIKISGSTNKVTSTSTSSSSSTSTSSDKIVLVLDAGHGGTDSGATGNGYREKDMTLSIILAAKKYFDKDDRFQVYYTRTSDTYPSLSDRCDLANKHNADLFVSAHINSASSSSATGTETLYNSSRNTTTAKNKLTSYTLATKMQKAAVKITGFTDRGLKIRTDLRVLNGTNMPACIIEYGFISNKTDAAKMNLNLEAYGKKLYTSICTYLKNQGRL